MEEWRFLITADDVNRRCYLCNGDLGDIGGDRGACLDCVWVKIRLDTEAGDEYCVDSGRKARLMTNLYAQDDVKT